MQLDNAALHHAILRHFVDRQHAPSVDELAAHFARPRDAVIAALKALQEYHGVVLHPTSSEIWVIHPFSAAPTNFWVQSPKGSWWGNCAWCSAGIAALAGEVTVTTTLGAEAKPVTVQISDGAVDSAGLLVHFPVPMRKVWDNVIYTCSTQLLFDSEAAIDDWCSRHRIVRGSVQPFARVCEFARVWYGRHLDADWKKWSADEAQAIFQRFGFTDAIWDLPTGGARF
jgi:hypothetical protein